MTRYATRDCGCEVTTGTGQARPKACELHGYRFLTEAQLNPPKRNPMRQISEKRQAEIEAGERPRTGSTLNRGRGFAVAPAQRAKVKLLACVGCGRQVDPEEGGPWKIDPAHLVPRSAGGCGDQLCVIPLCRNVFNPDLGCHRPYDLGELDIHGKLVDCGYFAEMAHAIEAHHLSPLTLVQRLTGETYMPAAPFVREVELLQARIVELEAGVIA